MGEYESCKIQASANLLGVITKNVFPGEEI